MIFTIASRIWLTATTRWYWVRRLTSEAMGRERMKGKLVGFGTKHSWRKCGAKT